jgi:hypothetical protein
MGLITNSGGIWTSSSLLTSCSVAAYSSLGFDQLRDPYEGALTKPTAEFFADIRSRTGFRGGVNNEVFRKVRCVNCWHMSEYESAAMWELYSKDAGVGIRSSITRLESSFPPEVTGGSWGIRGNAVSYVDYEKDRVAALAIDGSVVMSADFFCKRKSFEHEHEYRLVTVLESDEYDQVGKHVPVLLEQLIEQVVVSPLAPTWITEVVRNEVRLHGLSVSVKQSDLYSPLLK